MSVKKIILGIVGVAILFMIASATFHHHQRNASFKLGIYNTKAIQGNGHLMNKSITTSPFDNLKVEGPFKIMLSADQKQQHITLEASSNLLPYIVTDVKNNTLIIKPKLHTHLSPKHAITLTISMHQLKHLTSVNDSQVTVLAPKADVLTVIVANHAQVTLSGTANQLNGIQANSSQLQAQNMQANIVNAQINNASTAQLNVQQKLHLTVNNGATATVKGQVQTATIIANNTATVNADNLLIQHAAHIVANNLTQIRVHLSNEAMLTAIANDSSQIHYQGSPQLNIRTSLAGQIAPLHHSSQ